jgi:hypothetical protein
MKSENLNFLEPSGPLQASNGASLLYLTFDELNIAVADGVRSALDSSSSTDVLLLTTDSSLFVIKHLNEWMENKQIN